MLRLATYNVENLFERAMLFGHTEWAGDQAGEQGNTATRILDAYAKASTVLARHTYSQEDKDEIVRLIDILGLTDSDDSKYVLLRRNRGRLLERNNGTVRVVADGRDDWLGWLELKMEAVNEQATRNTGRVINNINADVLVVVEAEHRPSLLRFNEQVLQPVVGWRYDHILVMDGNDARGIDVGLCCRSTFPVDFMRSHVDDLFEGKRIFSRDCAEYHVVLPDRRRLVILANHFKSKGNGKAAENDALRNRQARRVREIYEELRQSGNDLVAIMGDLNDSPDRAPLAPLLREGSDLADASEIEGFDSGGRPGTWRNGEARNKIDYILMSPALCKLARGGAIYRAGVWGGEDGTLFPHLPEITSPSEAASDHAALYVDLDIQPHPGSGE